MIMTEIVDPAVVVDGSLSASDPIVRVDAVVPFQVRYHDFRGGRWKEENRSQEEIGRDRFLRIQAGAKKLPGTSQPSPGAFYDTYTSLHERGFNQILVLTVPAGKSGTYNSAV